MTRQQNSDAPDLPADIMPKMISPGSTVGGRYRLLEQVGGDHRIGATFWRARDSVLDRDVALTTLTGPGGPRSVQTALAAGQLEHAGIARILDVLSESRQTGPGLTGLLVTEWIDGTDLATLATEATKTGRTLPTAMISRALSPLASAIETAHRAGFALGVDQPQKIRVGNDGLARVAFPVASASDQQADDVRGLGAAIYLLLTGRWPLPDPPDGLTSAPTGSNGVVAPAQELRPAASPTLAMLAQRCLAGGSASGVYTSAAVHQMLEQVNNAEAETMRLAAAPVAGNGWPGGPLPSSTDPARKRELARRRKLAVGLAVLGVVVLTLVVWAASQVASFFSDNSKTGSPGVVLSKSNGPSQPGGGQTNTGSQLVPAGPVRPAGIAVFDVTGDPDNPARAPRAIDGDPRSSWKTYDYNQPFPTLKPGVGVLVSFAEPVTVAAVQVDSPSAGATVEIRTAPASDAGLAGTTVLGTATLVSGRTEIRLNQPAPSQRVLVWITGLADRGGKHSTELAELTFLRAS